MTGRNDELKARLKQARADRATERTAEATPAASKPADEVQLVPYTDEEQAKKLAEEIAVQRARREAKRVLDAEDRAAAPLPEVLTLRERLARPRDPVAYRIDGWQPIGGRVVLAAQFKAGKTTLVHNLARVLVDGGLFLGRDLVAPVAGTVAIIDIEMTGAQLDKQLSEQKVVNDDRIVMLLLRGAASAFDILDPGRRSEWAKLLREQDVSYLVLDCLRPVLDALGLDENHDAGRFLVAFDELLAEACIGEALIVHHMGHTAERARGDSRLLDWPDAGWTLVRQDEAPRSPRYLAAYGRDVDQPEAQLHYDQATRHLTLTGGNRRDAEASGALGAVLLHVAAEPGQSKNQIETALHGVCSQKAVRAALGAGVRNGQLRTEPGPRNAELFYVTTPTGHAPQLPQAPQPAEVVE